jgi:uncharacterized protein
MIPYKPENTSESGLVFPVPLKTKSEDNTIRQNEHQRRVQQVALEMIDTYSKRSGRTRREFLSTSCGAAVVYMAMNAVFGEFFSVQAAEATDSEVAEKRKNSLSPQFIFDIQTHFVSPSYKDTWILALRERSKKWNPELKGEKTSLEKIGFENFYREIYELSDTKIAMLTSAPNDDPKRWFVHNNEMAETRKKVNDKAGRKILYCHAVFTPGQPGWMESLDRDISEYKPDGWKGYTTGAPFEQSKYPWRLDDEKLVYPAYEKMVKAGITNVCIHKGLLPSNYETRMASNWHYGKIEDLGKAAKDWPQLNFLIYHSAVQSGEEPTTGAIKEFEATGHIPWITELAAIPQKYGVKNVYAEIGGTFAITSVSAPQYCAGILGILVKGLGADHVLWGTDSVWHGSPQWQIETFRRLEIPHELRKKFGFDPLGPEDGEIKKMILGQNAARIFNVKL